MGKREIIDMVRLKTLHDQGFSVEETAQQLGSTPETIRTILGAVERVVESNMVQGDQKFKKCA